MFQKRYKGERSRGLLLIDIIVAFALASLFVVVVAGSSTIASRSFYSARSREALFESFESGKYTKSARPYGNDRIEILYAVATGTGSGYESSFSVDKVELLPNDYLSEFSSNPLCSIDLIKGPDKIFVESISLPLPTWIGLTDIQVRWPIVYAAADSSTPVDSDIFTIDISSTTAPNIKASLNTGPGLRSIVVVGNKIYAAAPSAVGQLHIININKRDSLTIEKKYTLPLPYATATPAMGNSISYHRGFVYLGTEKWVGEELNVINVANPSAPQKTSGIEIGSKVNAIVADRDQAFVASSDVRQLIVLDISSDISSPGLVRLQSSFSPSGSSRQDGKAINLFEGSLAFGRTSGGYDIASDNELFILSATSSDGSIVSDRALNIPGGIYGIVSDRNGYIVGTHQVGKELQIFDRNLYLTQTYHLPVFVEKLTCDRDSIYVLAKDSPTIYKISHEK